MPLNGATDYWAGAQLDPGGAGPSNGPARSAVFYNTLTTDQVLTAVSRGVYVSTAGDLKVDMVDTGTAVLFKAIQAGTLLPIRVTKLYSLSNGSSAGTGVTVIY